MRGKKPAQEDTAAEAKGTAEPLPEDMVKLPALFGIRPGQYLAVLYGLIALIILFFVFCYPGIAHPGSMAAFSSEPSGAAIRVDGLTRGSAPCTLFVPQGTRTIEMVLPGFSPLTIEADIRGRLLGSLLFPRRARISGSLSAEDPLEALRLAAARYGAWSFAGEPTAAYQIPQELSEGAYRSGPAAADPAARQDMEGILAAALRFTVTRAALRDMIRAKTLVGNGGLSPSPVTLLRSVPEMLAHLSESPGAAAWLADMLPREAAGMTASSAWYAENAAKAAPLSGEEEYFQEKTLELGGMAFRRIEGGDFWIAVSEVSPASWAAFLAARPEWGPENTGVLQEQGLVNADYLVKFPSPGGGVPGISWYAAEAYCQWLGGLLPPALAGYEARLPLEAEWEYAAKLAPEGFFGGHWEWCGDPYAPLDFFPASPRYINAVSSPERSLRGGAWINPAGSTGIETRASLPPNFCSAFVSLRPVIAPRTRR